MNKMILMLSLMLTQVAIAQSLSLSLGIEKAEKGGGAKTFNVNRINVETVALRGHHEKSEVRSVWVNYDDGTTERLSQLERTLRQGDYVEARVDYRRYVRSVSVDASSSLIGSRGRYEVLITYNDRPAPYDPPQRPPNRPPRPPHRPEPPQYGSDLRGYCDDYDHREFTEAKDFASSSSGLNRYSHDATTWAVEYVRTHRCGTIGEYKARYSKLFDFAYEGEGLNRNIIDARNWALGYVESLTVYEIEERVTNSKSIKQVAYSSSGLNKNIIEAAQIAERWFYERCDSRSRIENDFWPQYKREYDFAYSSRGLGYNIIQARQYAIDRTANMLLCGHLLR